MSSGRRSCLNNPDSFCYICGEYTFKENRKTLCDFIKKAYLGYFGVKLGDQDKNWAPHQVCKTCTEHLRQWTTGKRKNLKFGNPLVCREPKNHVDDCYFCMVNITGINRNNRSKWTYPDPPSARRPSPHSHEVPIPTFHQLPELEDGQSSSDQYSDNNLNEGDGDYEGMSSVPQRFRQEELNDLVRDLNLSKAASELLASRLNDKNLLERGTKITYYRTREKNLLPFLSQENNHVYCHEVSGLLEKMGSTEYFPHDWRLFIDSSKRSLKCVLLHNGNKLGSIPIAHSTKMKEDYNTISLVLEKIKYHEHHWVICVDLKMVNFLLGQQSGYTKFPCFLCLWDNRDRSNHWIKRYWPNRESMDVEKNNIINEPLVDREKIIFPPLHIKLGLMKQFVKALDKNGSCFLYLVENMPQLSIEKIKAGIFDGPQIRQLINDTAFLQSMNEVELKAWTLFVAVIEKFLGNHKSENYMDVVNEMLTVLNLCGVT